jgi:hypothetical protein
VSAFGTDANGLHRGVLRPIRHRRKTVFASALIFVCLRSFLAYAKARISCSDVVCDEKLWDLVGEECGLGLSIGPAIRLVYSKYLCSIDAWMNEVVKSKVAHEYDLVDERNKSKKRSMELQVESKEFLSGCAEHGVDDDYRLEEVVCF